MKTIGFDECGMTDTTTATNISKNQHCNNIKVNNLKYASYDSRIRSFRKWPKCYTKYFTENLSEAGFFYTGISDKIECFLCGLHLCNWNDSDNPLDQLIIWSQNCPFLKMTKGTLYIQQTREKFVVKDDTNDE